QEVPRVHRHDLQANVRRTGAGQLEAPRPAQQHDRGQQHDAPEEPPARQAATSRRSASAVTRRRIRSSAQPRPRTSAPEEKNSTLVWSMVPKRSRYRTRACASSETTPQLIQGGRPHPAPKSTRPSESPNVRTQLA